MLNIAKDWLPFNTFKSNFVFWESFVIKFLFFKSRNSLERQKLILRDYWKVKAAPSIFNNKWFFKYKWYIVQPAGPNTINVLWVFLMLWISNSTFSVEFQIIFSWLRNSSELSFFHESIHIFYENLQNEFRTHHAMGIVVKHITSQKVPAIGSKNYHFCWCYWMVYLLCQESYDYVF